MSAVTDTAPSHHEEEAPYVERVSRNRLGLWIFFFSEIFLFGALFAARFYLWGNTRPDLDQTVGLIATSILLLSSFFVARAETAITHGNQRSFLINLVIGALLGTAFLVSVVGIEWGGELKATDGAFGAIFYLMTGLHALHVLSGVVLMVIIGNNGRKGLYTSERHWPVEGMANYWHYVDVVWVFFYPALYLIGTPQ